MTMDERRRDEYQIILLETTIAKGDRRRRFPGLEPDRRKQTKRLEDDCVEERRCTGCAGCAGCAVRSRVDFTLQSSAGLRVRRKHEQEKAEGVGGRLRAGNEQTADFIAHSYSAIGIPHLFDDPTKGIVPILRRVRRPRSPYLNQSIHLGIHRRRVHSDFRHRSTVQLQLREDRRCKDASDGVEVLENHLDAIVILGKLLTEDATIQNPHRVTNSFLHDAQRRPRRRRRFEFADEARYRPHHILQMVIWVAGRKTWLHDPTTFTPMLAIGEQNAVAAERTGEPPAIEFRSMQNNFGTRRIFDEGHRSTRRTSRPSRHEFVDRPNPCPVDFGLKDQHDSASDPSGLSSPAMTAARVAALRVFPLVVRGIFPGLTTTNRDSLIPCRIDASALTSRSRSAAKPAAAIGSRRTPRWASRESSTTTDTVSAEPSRIPPLAKTATRPPDNAG